MNRFVTLSGKFLFLICLLFIGLGILTRVIAFLYNRTLFLDEAFLASSVVQRGYAGLFRPLDYDQGAPVGFLLVVKTFVYIFGSSEYVLRLLSLLSGLGSIALFWLILKDIFRDTRPYIPMLDRLLLFMIPFPFTIISGGIQNIRM